MLSEDLLSERRGRAGVITLNRPKALNVLTLGMVHGIRRGAVEASAADPEVAHVVVSADGREGLLRRRRDLAPGTSAGQGGPGFDEMMGFYSRRIPA